MELFTQQYESFLSYASGIIKRHRINVEPADLVNEAYLQFISTNKPFNRDEIIQIISRAGFNEKQDIHNVMESGRPAPILKEDICCNKCHVTKPASAYQIIRCRGYVYSSRICKACCYERQKERRKINPSKSYYKPKPIPLALAARNKPPGRPKKYKYSNDLTLQEKKNICFKEWVKTNRDKWNAYMRSRNRTKKIKAA